METRNPDFEAAVRSAFSDARFVAELGVKLISVAPGRCAAALDLTPQHLQHLGRVHGGVITTVAGHAALGAAMSIAADGGPLVLPSFSMNLLRSAESGRLLAEATVVKGGATLVFVETDVFNTDQGSRTLIAKAAFTFARAPAAR